MNVSQLRFRALQGYQGWKTYRRQNKGYWNAQRQGC